MEQNLDNKTKGEQIMYYEINVTLNGQHLFATDKRSITNKVALKVVYKIIKEKFPQEEGYHIMVSQWETKGKYIDMEQEF
jgi:hypothetical protein